jgi:lysophospholipid acyltransferase (LPLAT)-like uncharacterized protein
MTFSWKERVKINIVAFLATWAMRIWFFSVRVEIIDRDIYDDFFLQRNGKHRIVAGSWHRHAIFLFYFFRNLGDRLIMISKSKDGEMTAGIARRLGYTPVRGSSSRGGGEALTELIQAMKSKEKTYLCGTPVDGPRGPARKLKKGMVILARETDAYFIPMACSGTRLWTFHKAWDKTILPKPFSKMVVGFGRPCKIPSDLESSALQERCLELEEELNKLTDRVDQICGYKGR